MSNSTAPAEPRALAPSGQNGFSQPGGVGTSRFMMRWMASMQPTSPRGTTENGL